MNPYSIFNHEFNFANDENNNGNPVPIENSSEGFGSEILRENIIGQDDPSSSDCKKLFNLLGVYSS